MRWRLVLMIVTLGVLALGRLAAAGEPAPPEPGWPFTAPDRPPVPAVRHKDQVVNPIDAFVLAKLEATGLSFSARADKLTLLRRVTVDLTGLPPTVAEQDAFLADPAPDAYARVVDRLLDSPRYGERWAQHWLDLVRYAETDGFKADDLRPQAYRYRDYVVRALNADLPFDRFVRQQLAGDELEPDHPDALVATGFNRLWPDEYNAANLEQRRQEVLDDVTDVTGAVFLGLTVGCARCHDHKFDPISQVDYFRLQAFFAALQPRDDLVAADAGRRQRYRAQRDAWEKATRGLRAEMDALLADKRAELRQHALTKFRLEIQQAVLTPAAQRTPYQEQIALLAEKQLQREETLAPTRLPEDRKKRYQELEGRLAAAVAPEALPPVLAVVDVGREAPPVHRLAGGDWRKPTQEVRPGFPHVLGDVPPDTHLDAPLPSTGRRAALARWLTRPDHPLTGRVLVNRLWQHHFGAGIVATPSDFGAMGEPPTHPELLDWLAVDFVGHGWSLKHLHRLMVTSAAYCQTSLVDSWVRIPILTTPRQDRNPDPRTVDRDNKLLWHARRRRLEGEAIRDALLGLTGELNPRMFGVSARPKLPAGISSYAWKPDNRPEEQNRRSVYVFAKRNLRYPLFDAFDLPDMHNSCARRTTTTTAPQALVLLNGDFTLERARRWAGELLGRFPHDDRALVAHAYRAAWGRLATDEEIALGLDFLKKQGDAHSDAVTDFCHALVNANEFLYVD
jgi:hypothetical protein